jgi:hypothetical protein
MVRGTATTVGLTVMLALIYYERKSPTNRVRAVVRDPRGSGAARASHRVCPAAGCSKNNCFRRALRLRTPTFSKMFERRLWMVYSDRLLWEEVVRTEWQKSAMYASKIPGYFQPEVTRYRKERG